MSSSTVASNYIRSLAHRPHRPVSFIGFQMTYILNWPPAQTYAGNPRRKRPYPVIKLVWWSIVRYTILWYIYSLVYVMEEASCVLLKRRWMSHRTIPSTVCLASMAPHFTYGSRRPRAITQHEDHSCHHQYCNSAQSSI